MDSWILAALVDELLYLTVRIFVLVFHIAYVAPASLADFSIFFLNVPHSPETLKDSVLTWARPATVIAIQVVATNNILSVFMKFKFMIQKKLFVNSELSIVNNKRR